MMTIVMMMKIKIAKTGLPSLKIVRVMAILIFTIMFIIIVIIIIIIIVAIIVIKMDPEWMGAISVASSRKN